MQLREICSQLHQIDSGHDVSISGPIWTFGEFAG